MHTLAALRKKELLPLLEEINDHRKDKRVACPLAAHVHHCDNTSARIFPENGKGLG